MINIYQTIYNLINTYIFGNIELVSGSNEELITMLLSSFATILLFALPFVAVYKIIKMIIQ